LLVKLFDENARTLIQINGAFSSIILCGGAQDGIHASDTTHTACCSGAGRARCQGWSTILRGVAAQIDLPLDRQLHAKRLRSRKPKYFKQPGAGR